MDHNVDWRKSLAELHVRHLLEVGCFIDDLNVSGDLPEADRNHLIEKIDAVRRCIQDICMD